MLRFPIALLSRKTNAEVSKEITIFEKTYTLIENECIFL